MRTTIASLAVVLAFCGSALARATVDPDQDAFDGSYLPGWDMLMDDGSMAQSGGTTTTPPPPVTTPPVTTSPVTPPVTTPPVTPQQPPALDQPDPGAPPVTEDGGEETYPEDEFSLGDLPVVETVELNPDLAKRAIDAYLLVRDKYKDAELENFENLQDFVDQAPQGKAFEADIKAAGFPNVGEWNTVVTTISFAYANIVDDQTEEIRQQIEEIRNDTEMAQDMRERMIAALQAMIPSDNNRKVVEDLLKDPVYGNRIKTLETEEE